jgi:putative OPT family oligopeptide transporter
VLLGSFLGVVFGLVTVYVALEVGLNFSASIPISVLSITVFKYFGRSSTLENNIVQTTGSAGESIAAGVVYTMPALLFLGYQLEIWRIFWVAFIGGLIGVFFMVPLRHYLVVQQHGELNYPEGTACADILIAGERGGKFARKVFSGLIVGLLYKFAMSGLRLWAPALRWDVSALRGAVVAIDPSPELLGLGCLVGVRVARLVFAGSALSSLVLTPLIYFFGERLPSPIYPSSLPIGAMSPADVWSSYLRYVGAGAVIAGGVLLLVDALPVVAATIRKTLRELVSARSSAANTARTEQDLPMAYVAAGSALMLVFLYILLVWKINLHAGQNLLFVGLVAIFGLFFVVVSARVTGLMGSSANPISGITIAVVMLTCLLFAFAGWTGSTYEIVAVSIGATVCIAASNAGTTAQDLKTGYLVGATPWLQQTSLLIGVLTSVLVIGFTLMWLNGGTGKLESFPAMAVPQDSRLMQAERVLDGKTYDVYAVRSGANIAPGRYWAAHDGQQIAFHEVQRIGSAQLPAPQAQVMAILVEGLLNGRMRWRLLLIGVLVALVMELCGVRSLPFAVGMYLPLSATATLLIGALIGQLARKRREPTEDAMFEPGVLYSSGLIAGGAICAVALAALSSLGWTSAFDLGAYTSWKFLHSAGWTLTVFVGLCLLLWRESRARG